MATSQPTDDMTAFGSERVRFQDDAPTAPDGDLSEALDGLDLEATPGPANRADPAAADEWSDLLSLQFQTPDPAPSGPSVESGGEASAACEDAAVCEHASDPAADQDDANPAGDRPAQGHLDSHQNQPWWRRWLQRWFG